MESFDTKTVNSNSVVIFMSSNPPFQTPDPSALKNQKAEDLIQEGVLDESLETSDLHIEHSSDTNTDQNTPDYDRVTSENTTDNDQQIIRTNISAG